MNLDSFLQTAEAIKSYSLSPIEYISESSPTESNFSSNNEGICGFLCRGRLFWRANHGTIEIFDTQSNCRIAAWTFGGILHNTQAKVICVCGIGARISTHVAVGVDLGKEKSPRGLVGIICLHSSRLVRAFQLPHKVSTVCMVSGGDRIIDKCTLSNELRCCNGILAVSTANVGIFLIDLCLDYGGDKITSNEICPATYSDIVIPDKNPEWRRSKAVCNKCHPMLCLSDNMSTENGPFQLLGPNQNVIYEAPCNTVDVTAMEYIPQLSSLIIGYSFGSFQIINLSGITIDCASPYEDDFPPVVGLTYQEPENDPRNFVYLWVARSWNTGYSIDDELPPETTGFYLYAMNYEKKEWIEEHGLWYQNLLSMAIRFDFDAAACLDTPTPSALPPVIFSSLTVDNATSLVEFGATSSLFSTSDEESGPVPELSLSFFGWKGSFVEQGKLTTQHYIAVFDINQWYQARMPSQLVLDKKRLCPYMNFCILNDLPQEMDDSLIAVTPITSSWSRYCSRNSNENDWYPSSLSFEFQFLTSHNLTTYRCLNIQERVLASLLEQGPAAIVNPEYAHACCEFSGLLLQTDVKVSSSKLQVVAQREEILNVAINHQLMSFINQCVVEFSLGKYCQLGCSLSLLLEWGWGRVLQIKSQANTLCSPFSPSVIPLTAGTLTVLHHLLTSLNHLLSLIISIRDAAGEAVNINVSELDLRIEVVELLHLNLQASLWFHQCGLLPQNENDENSCIDEGHISFPAQNLENIYSERHVELNKLSEAIKSSDLLLIETICEECGPVLREIWDRDDSAGVYPPPSLQSMLSAYLLPSVPAHVKHRMVQYLFLDLAWLLSESCTNVVEELVKFPSSFSLSPSIIKLTQAFWLIDHKDFEEGLTVLLHPLVNPDDITPKQHRAIIKAFLYQGEENCALSYCKIRNPPKVDIEDIQLHLTLLLACGKIREAFHYQRIHRIEANADQLLHHLFSGCVELHQLKSILKLPLSSYEEQTFVKFLSSCKTAMTEDVLLAHFIQNSKFSDIYHMHQTTSHIQNQGRQKARNALMQGYLTYIPKYRQPIVQTNKVVRKDVTKLQPMSASIRQLKNNPTPKSFAFGHKQQQCPPITPFRSKQQRRVDWSKKSGIMEIDEEDSHIEGTQIVFPTIQSIPKSMETENSNIFFDSPYLKDVSQRNTYQSPANCKQSEVYKILEQVLKQSMMDVTPEKSYSYNIREQDSNLGSEFVSLLRTPTSKKVKRTSEKFSETPQSILKIRKAIQGTPNPISSDNMPFVSSVVRKLQRVSPDKDETHSCSDQSDTPKQLRFHLPHSKRLLEAGSPLESDPEEKKCYQMDHDLQSSLILENVSGNSSGLLDEETFHSLTEEMETDKEAVADELGHYLDHDQVDAYTKNTVLNMELSTSEKSTNFTPSINATILQTETGSCPMEETTCQSMSSPTVLIPDKTPYRLNKDVTTCNNDLMDVTKLDLTSLTATKLYPTLSYIRKETIAQDKTDNIARNVDVTKDSSQCVEVFVNNTAKGIFKESISPLKNSPFEVNQVTDYTLFSFPAINNEAEVRENHYPVNDLSTNTTLEITETHEPEVSVSDSNSCKEVVVDDLLNNSDDIVTEKDELLETTSRRLSDVTSYTKESTRERFSVIDEDGKETETIKISVKETTVEKSVTPDGLVLDTSICETDYVLRFSDSEDGNDEVIPENEVLENMSTDTVCGSFPQETSEVKIKVSGESEDEDSDSMYALKFNDSDCEDVSVENISETLTKQIVPETENTIGIAEITVNDLSNKEMEVNEFTEKDQSRAFDLTEVSELLVKDELKSPNKVESDESTKEESAAQMIAEDDHLNDNEERGLTKSDTLCSLSIKLPEDTLNKTLSTPIKKRPSETSIQGDGPNTPITPLRRSMRIKATTPNRNLESVIETPILTPKRGRRTGVASVDVNEESIQEEPEAIPKILIQPPTEDKPSELTSHVKTKRNTPQKRAYVDSPMRKSVRTKGGKCSKLLDDIQEEANSPAAVQPTSPKPAEKSPSPSIQTPKRSTRKSMVPRLDIPLRTIIEDKELNIPTTIVKTDTSTPEHTIRRSPRSRRSDSEEFFEEPAMHSITKQTPERTTRRSSISRETPERTTRRSSISRETPERMTGRRTPARETPERITRSSHKLETPERVTRSHKRETPDRVTRGSSVTRDISTEVPILLKPKEKSKTTPGRTARRLALFSNVDDTTEPVNATTYIKLPEIDVADTEGVAPVKRKSVSRRRTKGPDLTIHNLDMSVDVVTKRTSTRRPSKFFSSSVIEVSPLNSSFCSQVDNISVCEKSPMKDNEQYESVKESVEYDLLPVPVATQDAQTTKPGRGTKRRMRSFRNFKLSIDPHNNDLLEEDEELDTNDRRKSKRAKQSFVFSAPEGAEFVDKSDIASSAEDQTAFVFSPPIEERKLRPKRTRQSTKK